MTASNLSGSTSIEFKSSGTLSVKSHASGTLWWAAGYFANECKKVETEHQAAFFPNGKWQAVDLVVARHQSYAVSSVMQAFNSMEALINEFYGELESDGRSVAKAFAPQVRIDLIKQDLKKCRKKSPLAKYNVALHSAGKPKFDEGKGLGQEFNSLRELRNAMTHYRPEWSDRLDEHSDLETRLKSKFPQSALMPVAGMAWFPNRCFGAGSAAWALDVSERFVREFCQRIGIAHRLEHTTFKP